MVSLIVCGFIGIVAMMTIGSLLLPFPVPFVGTIFFMIILAVGIIKRKKDSPSMSYTSNTPLQTPRSDETQFWVCPNCGDDTQMKDESNIVSLAKNIYKVKKIRWGVVVK